VLAAWLFAQYLLTNEVQLGYAETEGYMPVTAKAQRDESYLDYLSRAGEDNDTHYAVKIAATKIGLDNVDKTFVTPVFNGSASLRDAAGQLIEEVTKAMRRRQTVNDASLDKLFADIQALYRLDQISLSAGTRAELGPLPTASKALLVTLAAVWALMGVYVLIERVKKKK